MRPDKAHKDRLLIIPDYDNQSIFIAANVKHHPTIGEETRTAVVGLDVRWGTPRRFTHLSIPGFERLFRLLTPRLLPELSEGSLGDDAHGQGSCVSALACGV